MNVASNSFGLGTEYHQLLKRQPFKGQMSPIPSSILESQDHFMGTSKASQEENTVTISTRRSRASFQQAVIQLIDLEPHNCEIFTVHIFYICLKKRREL